MKRILQGVAAVVVLALVIGAATVWVQRDALVAWWTMPKVHYVDLEKPPLPVYFFDQWWSAHPDHPDGADRKSTRLNSSHSQQSRMPSSA